ncbi:MAG: PDDEXK nuclease domain-containing protein [Bacilli bacterium]|nr:PDDEXK nuclease domain-containing protein [Bacilli bacterium]
MDKEIINFVKNAKEDYLRRQRNVYSLANFEQLGFYFYLGEGISKILKNRKKSNYKKETLQSISEELTKEIGIGFSRPLLNKTVIFYTKYKKCSTLSNNLTWSMICELIFIKNDDERKFYEIECVKERWSVRDLRRQIKSCYYQRKLLANQNAIVETKNQLTTIGNQISKPQDIIVNPVVLNFFKSKEKLKEKEIENSITQHLKEFFLELGTGFKFIDNQYQITINTNNYFVDLVFYNVILKAFVLIELKASPLTHTAVGQINLYLNYFKQYINQPGDNDPIGIIMCTDTNNLRIEYALGNISNQIFVTKYITHLPKKEDLERELLLARKK